MIPKPAAAIALLLALASAARAADAPKVTFKEVAAVFQQRCNSCHNADKQKGGLSLDSYTTAMAGGASGAVVEPGDPDASRLFELASHSGEPKMPPNSPRIADAELDVIKKWIEGGAADASGAAVAMKKPKNEFKLDPSAIGKPSGTPAMPEHLSTEPAVVSSRPNAVVAMAASPWAPLVAIAGHKQVLLYDTTSYRLLGVLAFPEGTIHSLRFSRDGGVLLAGGGRGGQMGRAIAWDVKTGERLFEVGKEYDVVISADISPDRSLVALGGPSKVLKVYSTGDGELVYENNKHTEWVTAVEFSPDGVLLASGDRNGGLLVWEAVTGREFYDLRGHGAMITDVSWRLDANVLASASEDGTARLWEMQNGNQIKSWGAHGGGAASVRFAKDGRIVTAGRDKVVKLWDGNGGLQRQFEPFGDLALQAVVTHDGAAVVAGDWSGEVRVWEAKEGKRLANLAANPAPVAVRLDAARKAADEARAVADAATKELTTLQQAAGAQAAAVNQAQQDLAAAQQADADARAAALAADQAVGGAYQAEQAASAVYSSADFERNRANTLREELIRQINSSAEALQTAAASASMSPRDAQVAERAAAALAAATAKAEAELPGLAATIEVANPARLAVDRATAARVAAQAKIPAVRRAAQVAAEAVPPRQATLAAAQAAQAAADKAVADKAPAVQSLIARADALKAEVEALAAERQAAGPMAAAAAPAGSS